MMVRGTTFGSTLDSRLLVLVFTDLAARICAAAHPGQILISRGALQDALKFLGEEVPELGRLRCQNHGSFLLKGSQQSLQICEVGLEGWESPGKPGLAPGPNSGRDQPVVETALARPTRQQPVFGPRVFSLTAWKAVFRLPNSEFRLDHL